MLIYTRGWFELFYTRVMVYADLDAGMGCAGLYAGAVCADLYTGMV